MEYNAEADSLARRFYQKDPFYKPQYYDPASFTEILDNYYTMPKFSVWLAYSRPSVAVRLDTVYVITIDTLQRKPDYEYNTNAVQLGFEYHPLKFLSVSVAPTFTYYKYTRSIRRHEFAMHYYKERYSVFSLPVRVEAGWYGKKSEKKKVTVVPSLFAGVQPKYVINSNYQIYTDIIVYTIDSQGNLQDVMPFSFSDEYVYSVSGVYRCGDTYIVQYDNQMNENTFTFLALDGTRKATVSIPGFSLVTSYFYDNYLYALVHTYGNRYDECYSLYKFNLDGDLLTQPQHDENAVCRRQQRYVPRARLRTHRIQARPQPDRHLPENASF